MQNVKYFHLGLLILLSLGLSSCVKPRGSTKIVPSIKPSDIPPAGESPFLTRKVIVTAEAPDIAIVLDTKVITEDIDKNLPAPLKKEYLAALARLNPKGIEAEVPLEFAIRVKNPGAETLEAWAKFPGIVGIADQVNGYRMLSNDPAFSTQTAIQPPHLGVEAMAAQFETELGIKKDTPVLVAVIDTGLDLNSNDIPISDDLIGTNLIEGENPDKPSDTNGHGTRVASIVGAKRNNGIGIAGVASSGTKILPIRAFNSNGESSSTLLVNAIYRAANMGADIAVIAASGETTSCDPTMGHAISRAADKGMAVFMAAGNAGRRANEARKYELDSLQFFSPGCWGRFTSGAITVGSSQGARKHSDRYALFSNYGEGVEVLLPGVDIVALLPGGGVTSGQGTSFSVALAAGLATHVVSYLKAKDWPELQGTARHLRPQYLESILKAGAYRAAVGEDEPETKVFSTENLLSTLNSWGSESQNFRLSKLDNPRNREAWSTVQLGKYLEGSQQLLLSKNAIKPGEKLNYKLFAVELESGKLVDVTAASRCSTNQQFISQSDYGELETSASLSAYTPNTVNTAVITCRVEPNRWQKLESSASVIVDNDVPQPMGDMKILNPIKIGKEYWLLKSSYVASIRGKELRISAPATWTFSQTLKNTLSPDIFDISELAGGTPIQVTASASGISKTESFLIPQEDIASIEIDGFLGHSVVQGQAPVFQAEISNPGGNEQKQPIRVSWTLDGSPLGSSTAYVLRLPPVSPGNHRVEARYTTKLSGVSKTLTNSYSFEVISLDRGVANFFLIVEKAFANRATFVYAMAEYESRSFKAVTEQTEFTVSPNDGFVTVSPNGAVIVTDPAALGRTYEITGRFGSKSNTASVRPTMMDTLTGRTDIPREIRIRGNDTILWGRTGAFEVDEYLDGRIRAVSPEAVSWSVSDSSLKITNRGLVEISCDISAGFQFQVNAVYDGMRAQKTVVVPKAGPLTGISLLGQYPNKNVLELGVNGGPLTQSLATYINVNNEGGTNPTYNIYTCFKGTFKVDPPTGLAAVEWVGGGFVPADPTEIKQWFTFQPQASKPGTYQVTFDGGFYAGNGGRQNFTATATIKILEDNLLSYVIEGHKEAYTDGMGYRLIGRFSSTPDVDTYMDPSEFDVTFMNSDRTIPTWAKLEFYNSTIWVKTAKPYTTRTEVNEDYILKTVYKKTGLTKEYSFRVKGTNHFNLAAPVACPTYPAAPAPKAPDALCTDANAAKIPVAAGNGSAESPYLVCNADQLRQSLTNSENLCPASTPCNFRVGMDFDLSGIENFEPIDRPNLRHSYTLVLDGNGYSVKNLTQLDAETAKPMGLLRQCYSMNIKNWNFITPNIRGNTNVGTLCGSVSGGETEQVQVYGGNVTGVSSVGGVLGSMLYHKMKRVSNVGTDIHFETGFAGGLVGYGAHYSQISDSTSSANLIAVGGFGGGGTLLSGTAIGGLVGLFEFSTNTYIAGPDSLSLPDNFSTEEKISKYGGIIRSCWLGSGKRIEGGHNASYLGGVVGRNDGGVLYNVAAEGGDTGATITGTSGIGGLVGYSRGYPAFTHHRSGAILNSRSRKIRLIGSSRVGGLAGMTGVSILQQNQSTECRIEATSGTSVGGFIGAIWGPDNTPNRVVILDANVSNSVYSTGQETGGFIGSVTNPPPYPSVFEFFDGNRWRQNADPNFPLPDIGRYRRGEATTNNYNYSDTGVRLW